MSISGEGAYAVTEDLRQFMETNRITTVKLGAVDIDGAWRGKRISAAYFLESVASSGTNICNILFGWDMHDEPMPGLRYTGWHTGYPDITLRPDLSTLAAVPWEPGTASVICDIYERDGTPTALSPRGLLKDVVARAGDAGFSPVFAYEFEFYVFRGTARALADGGWRDLEPYSDGNHTYSVFRDTGSEELLRPIREQLAAYGVRVEASNSEHGPGQFEVNLHYADALRAADQAMLLKHSVKELVARAGCTASFIAKCHPEWAGSSGHVHQSLRDRTGVPAFANAVDPTQLTETGQSYLAGLVALAADTTALHLPTINSFKRTEGGSWAGSSSTWGMDNRTVAIRAIPSAGPAARVEDRVGGADANPYLVIAADLAAGLHGVQKGLTPPPAIVGNAYEQPDKASPLPRTLDEAVSIFESSSTVRSLLGETFVDHYAATRRWEIARFRAAVTEWEIARYLEHI